MALLHIWKEFLFISNSKRQIESSFLFHYGWLFQRLIGNFIPRKQISNSAYQLSVTLHTPHSTLAHTYILASVHHICLSALFSHFWTYIYFIDKIGIKYWYRNGCCLTSTSQSLNSTYSICLDISLMFVFKPDCRFTSNQLWLHYIQLSLSE